MVNYTSINRKEHNSMLSISRPLQDNFGGKNSYKSTEFWPRYDIMCQLALLGLKRLAMARVKSLLRVFRFR